MNDSKRKRIMLESQIITMIFSDNRNTVHFDYHVNIDSPTEGIQLYLYTKNAQHNEVFLLHHLSGTSSLDVLRKMMDYLRENHKGDGESNSYTVRWVNKTEDVRKENLSYFFEGSEEAVRRKFFFNRSPEDFEIVSITLNPMS